MRQNTTDDREDVTSQARNEDQGVEGNESSENWEKDGATNASSLYDWANALYADMFEANK